VSETKDFGLRIDRQASARWPSQATAPERIPVIAAASEGRRATTCAVLAFAFLALLAGGCHLPPPRPRKPNLYEVHGRVIDAETNRGVAGARVRLRATFQGPVGARHLTAYAVTGADGTYRAELSAGFDLVRHATEICLDASKRGHIPGGADLPPPAKERDFHEAPAIVIQRGRTLPPPRDLEGLGVPLLEPPPPNPLEWKR